MALINLLPSVLKRPKQPQKMKVKVKVEIPKITSLVFTIAIIITLLSLAVWISLLIQVKIKEKTLPTLTDRFGALETEYQKIEELTERKNELNEKLTFYQNIFEKNIVWLDKLRLINRIVPKQIWLTNLSTETKPTKMLLIKGSSTSLIEREIIDAISQFATLLKEDKDFQEVKLGPLVAEKKGKLSIMNFSLNCKLR